jgi:hypothetical protein
VARLFEAAHQNASPASLSALVTDSMVDALFVAGDPAHCLEQLRHVSALATEHGFEQLMFSELGSDVAASLHLVCEKIVPSL